MVSDEGVLNKSTREASQGSLRCSRDMSMESDDASDEGNGWDMEQEGSGDRDRALASECFCPDR